MSKQRTLKPNTPGIPLPAFSNSHRSTVVDAEQEAVGLASDTSDDVQKDPVAVSEALTPEVRASGRVLRQIPVSLIDANPLAPREVYTPQMISERASDLREQGQHDPIHVIPNPAASGRFIICDGWTRTQACLQHKVLDSLLAEIHENLSLQEAAWFGYQQNEGREQHCDLDRALFYEKMIDQGIPAAEISRRAGVSKSMMTFYRAFSRLPDDVLDIVKQNPQKIGATAAYQLFKLFERVGVRRTVALAMRFVADDQSVNWLTNQVQAMLHPEQKRATVPSKVQRFSNGQYKQFGARFELNLEVEDVAKRAAFADALERLIATVGEADEGPQQDGGKSIQTQTE
jgi:ParB family chromosome partitioning protein